MTQLPTLLQPWADSLALFPPDQATFMQELLQRIAPLLGPLRRQSATAAQEPQGVGAIRQRGSYEHLLISQWAYADAVPDEFIRRAANNELLFTGPEPVTSQRPLRSVALFDAGPAQLGAPRLAHLALFILLARRAQEAGADFQWGVLQEPGRLHSETGAAAIARLLQARSHVPAAAPLLDAWAGALDAALDDCWLVAAASLGAPPFVRSRAAVRARWQDAQLTLELDQSGRRRSVALPLPDESLAVRLLRQAADPAPAARAMVNAPASHSLKRAPLFGTHAEWVAVSTVDGAVTLYHVPQSLRTAPGRPRSTGKLDHFDSIIAVGLSKRTLGVLRQHDGALHPAAFPGALFGGSAGAPLALPERSEFHAPPGSVHLSPAVHMRVDGSTERLLVLDREGRLVCWTRTWSRQRLDTVFTVLAEDVIGIGQHEGGGLSFAVAGAKDVSVKRVEAAALKITTSGSLAHAGKRFLFGQAGAHALHLGERRWLVGDRSGAEIVMVDEGSKVLGCGRAPATNRPALLLLSPTAKRFEMQSAETCTLLFTSPEKVAQASFDARSGRLAWLTRKTGMLVVQGIGQSEPYLQALGAGATNAH